MKSSKIILASKSSIRNQLLKNAGVKFTVLSSNLDEDNIKNSGKTPEEIAQKLAFEKAKVISKDNIDTYIIGADQVLIFEGKILNKSPDKITAKEKLKDLSGKTHCLFSAISIVKNEKEVFKYSDKATLKMRDLSDEFIDNYLLNIDQNVLESVGSYQLEGLGIQLFEEIKGDYFTILGLPILPILDFFRLEKNMLL